MPKTKDGQAKMLFYKNNENIFQWTSRLSSGLQVDEIEVYTP